jgi:hypothetical protein
LHEGAGERFLAVAVNGSPAGLLPHNQDKVVGELNGCTTRTKINEAMIDQDLKDLWTPTGLLLGFQVTLSKWRLEREAEVSDKGDIPWLVPADYMSIVGMLTFVFGTVLMPLAGVVSTAFARSAFGLGALLFVGQALGLAGHY